VLRRPPVDPRDTAFRQAIAAELGDSEVLRRQLAELHASLARLRTLLDAGHVAPIEGVRRKLDVLAVTREAIELMAGGFAASSGLSRLQALGRELQASAEFDRLGQLLDFERHVATVDVRLRVGADGTMRDFEVLALRPNRQNPLVPSALRRFLSRLWAFVRGHRVRENEVLIRLVDDVFRSVESGILTCLLLTGEVELYLATLSFRDLCEGKGLEVCLPELVDPPALDASASERRYAEGLFNPLLLLQGIVPEPCDLRTDAHDGVVVVTGPNSGGKTRLLQAIALTQLLGQSGCYVPARRARLVRAPSIFVSLVDDTAADQREGRLGTELMRIRHAFELLEPGSLVVLDELCEGTNPTEGEAIFEMVLGLLPRLRPQVFITTHFLGLAARLEADPPVAGLSFLRVELDERERPTYRFVPGVAPSSLAIGVAERLGVTREALAALVEDKANEARRPDAAPPSEPPGATAGDDADRDPAPTP
jgi:DNA mismatch repair protein MutS2